MAMSKLIFELCLKPFSYLQASLIAQIVELVLEKMVPLSANVKLVLLQMIAVSLYVKDNPCVVTMVKTKY